MAQFQQYMPSHKDSFNIKKGVTYLGSDFPTGVYIQMKSKHKVNVSVNGGVMFPVSYDETSFKEDTYKYMFDVDCVVSVGTVVNTQA